MSTSDVKTTVTLNVQCVCINEHTAGSSLRLEQNMDAACDVTPRLLTRRQKTGISHLSKLAQSHHSYINTVQTPAFETCPSLSRPVKAKYIVSFNNIMSLW